MQGMASALKRILYRLMKKWIYAVITVQSLVKSKGFPKVVVLLLHRDKSGDLEKEAGCMQYTEVTTPLNVAEKNLACICARWSTYD